MTEKFEIRLHKLKESSNFRQIPAQTSGRVIDLSSNDYLGIASRDDLRDEFYASADYGSMALTSSASRLLAANQKPYVALEKTLESLYGRPALLFNSGYHANTGIVSAIADNKTMILADRLVHASIIDGMTLSRAAFNRFRHNDFDHLERLVEKYDGEYQTLLVIVESIYSMDGDRADIDRLIDIKRRYPSVMLYVDEAHAFGVEGPSGLGLVSGAMAPDEIDIVIGTLGKAAASFGAFCVVSRIVKDFLVNSSRSFIFSTALPPVSVAWSDFIVKKILSMDAERDRLRALSRDLSSAVSSISGNNVTPSHIIPFIIGDSAKAVGMSAGLLADGVKILPIRTPTVPSGTERLRIVLSASLTDCDMECVKVALKKEYEAAFGR